MSKTPAPLELRRTFALRLECAIKRQYPTLYAFERDYPAIGKRVRTWLLPQKRDAKDAQGSLNQIAQLCAPDAAGLVEIASALQVSTDWLLGLVGTDDEPRAVSNDTADLATWLKQAIGKTTSLAVEIDGVDLSKRLLAKALDEVRALVGWERDAIIWGQLAMTMAHAQQGEFTGNSLNERLLTDITNRAAQDAINAGPPDRPSMLILEPTSLAPRLWSAS